jgi:ribosomal protein L29
MEKADLKKMDKKALDKEILALRKKLFDLRLSVASTHIKDNSQFKKLRVKIAQALTCLNQSESAR